MTPNTLRSLKNKLESANLRHYGRHFCCVFAFIAFLHQLNVFISTSILVVSDLKNDSDSVNAILVTTEIIDEKYDRDCQCKEIVNLVTSNASLCGGYSASRGSEQKVISFSYFKHDFQNLANCAEAVLNLYPGYYMRVYHNISKADSKHQELCELFCQNDHIDLCDVSKLGKSYRKWIFE